MVRTALEIQSGTPASSGDVLCFLPSLQQINSAVERFRTLCPPEVCLAVALHGQQEYEEQLPALTRSHGARKVIFASSIAEMSVTIDGVRWVVDPGLSKQSAFDPIRKVSVVALSRISTSSAVRLDSFGPRHALHCRNNAKEGQVELRRARAFACTRKTSTLACRVRTFQRCDTF